MVIQMVFMNVPNGSNVFPNLGGIRRLKLRQLRTFLDFKIDFLPGGRQNLQIRRDQSERREIKTESISIHHPGRGNDMSKGRADLDVDRFILRVLSLRLWVFGLLGVGHGAEFVGEVWRVLNIRRFLPRRRWWRGVKKTDRPCPRVKSEG